MQKQTKPTYKESGIKILSFQLVVVPSAIPGQTSINVYGLGDDELMYIYEPEVQLWILVA